MGLAFRDEARPLTRKLAGGLIVSCFATLLAMVILANLPARAPAPAAQARASAPAETLGAREPSESSADFLERVALSHVQSLKAPAETEAMVAASESAAAPAARPSAAKRSERARSAKTRVAAAETAPPAQPALESPAPARPNDASAELDWMHPLQSGMRLIAGLDHVVAASKARIAEGVASVGGALASLGKPRSQ